MKILLSWFLIFSLGFSSIPITSKEESITYKNINIEENNSFTFGYISGNSFGISEETKLVNFISLFIEELNDHLILNDHENAKVNYVQLEFSSVLTNWEQPKLVSVINSILDGGKVISETYKTNKVENDNYTLEFILTYQDNEGNILSTEIFNSTEAFTRYELNNGKWGVKVKYEFKELGYEEILELDNSIVGLKEFNNELYIKTLEELYIIDEKNNIDLVYLLDPAPGYIILWDMQIYNNELYFASGHELLKIDKNKEIKRVLLGITVGMYEFNDELFLTNIDFEKGDTIITKINRNNEIKELVRLPHLKNNDSINYSFIQMVCFNNELYIGTWDGWLVNITKDEIIGSWHLKSSILSLAEFNEELYIASLKGMFKIDTKGRLIKINKKKIESVINFNNNLLVGVEGYGTYKVDINGEINKLIDEEYVLSNRYFESNRNLFLTTSNANLESKNFQIDKKFEVKEINIQEDTILSYEFYNNKIYTGSFKGNVGQIYFY